MLCPEMGRLSRVSLFVIGTSSSACVEHGPSLDEVADQWAEVVCERWTECGCPVEDCVGEQRRAFLDRWARDDRVPRLDCLNERLEVMRQVSCAFVPSQPFAWEQAACPIAPTFRGVGQPCEPAWERETFAGACQFGLVCDAATRVCLPTIPAPREGDPCLRSGRPDADDWLCADGLVCDEAGQCVQDDTLEPTPPPPLVCDGFLVF